MRNSLPSLCVVVPCYNEEMIIKQTFLRLQAKLKDMIGKSVAPDSKLIFVDDGSKDKTWEMLVGFSSKKAKISHSADTNKTSSIESKILKQCSVILDSKTRVRESTNLNYQEALSMNASGIYPRKDDTANEVEFLDSKNNTIAPPSLVISMPIT